MSMNPVQQIRKGLLRHRGAVAEVVRRTEELKEGGYSRQYVDHVLRGRGNNDAIVLIAAEVLRERDKKQADLTRRLDQQLTTFASTPETATA